MKSSVSSSKLIAAVACAIPVAMLAAATPAYADGTDLLGPTTVEDGSGFVGAGVGLSTSQPGDIEVTIPAGATVKQVLIYWDGADRQYAGLPPILGFTTDEIDVNGNTVEGVFIGGRSFISGTQQFAFRADITSLGLVSPGANTLTVQGLDFGTESVETGAGVLVVIDDGTTSTLAVYDGSDYAFINCSEGANCTDTVKKTFTFDAAASARTGDLTMFFTSVAGSVSGNGALRPSVIRIWVGAEPPIEIVNQLASVDGEEWDTVNVQFEIPAGVDQVEVQAFSEDLLLTGNLEASFKWLTAALGVPDEREGGQGCTPGYWKGEHHFADWTAPYAPGDLFSLYFDDAFPGMTLLGVLEQGGGGLNALGRHTVAALLNAASAEVGYDYTPQGVIDAFNAAYPGDDYESLKDELQGFNEQGCPLNNSDGSNSNPNANANTQKAKGRTR